MNPRRRKTLGIVISLVVLAVVGSDSFRLAFSYPDAITVTTGQPFIIDTGFPVVSVYSSNAASLEKHPWGKIPTRLTMDTARPGEFSVEFRLFGLIPLRKVSLVVEEPLMVVPGGHSIGVILRSSGLVVTGISPVETIDGREVWPARNAGIEVGDVILSVGDRRIRSKDELALAIDGAGKEGKWVELLVEKADGSVVKKVLWPVRHKDGGFRLGLLVKDSLAGVGTLTFYEKNSGLYAALGHVIAEGDSRKPVSMKEGQIVRATVTGVQPSKKGEPGEVLGIFIQGEDVIGNIMKNGPCGISGVLETGLVNPFYPDPIPLGFQSQVKKGPAEMLTTVNGRTVERFSIEIEQVFSGTGFSSKGFLVKITDPRLLKMTGGIVQGMSGSPIIQDGCLVGAITHVLVNDPARGYGTFAEWMAQEAHILPGASRTGAVAAFSEFPCKCLEVTAP
ncbi:MAG: SpoIVB peptidase [Candidatus Fermentithermobacillus carboniphilus]|uniref:SpoIVB peptidase n=1 Tax=Candidatus Fermentithermobacillus carboniphilus TaxID=3085328 RepID=A0AAT9LCW2_9FIRM|nr:MAG: SpoIVB peptidase [Candidatus Fermentithermobacillus carboniphilus]